MDRTGEARAAVLRDVDSFGDWLGAELYQAPVQRFERQLKDVTPEDFKGWTVPRLMALALDAGQQRLTRVAALDAISARYLALPGSVAYVERLEMRAAA